MKTATKASVMIAMITGICSAQDATKVRNDPPKFYQLNFVLKEVDEGRVFNSRTYSMVAATDNSQGGPSIRTGSKVPISSGGSGWNYNDVGVDFDCRFLGEAGKSIFLHVTAESSSLAGAQEPPAGNLPPVIRQNKWSATVVVPVGKPTIIFSSDDLTSKHKLQVELTATPIIP
jgi:hypothetical protein